MTRCAPRSLRTVATLAALLTLACGTARGPALSAHDTPRSAPLPPSEPEPAESLDASAWTESRWLGVRVPATREELDALELPSPHVASANGRVICLDLRGGDARKALEAISGPVTILLPSLDPELVKQVNRVAGRFPVAVSYETPANLGGEVDLTPLSELSNIQGLQLFVGSGELPDLRGLARLRWLALRYAGFAADSLERLPTGIEDLTYDGPLQFDTVGRLGRFPRLRRLSTAMRGLNWSPLDRLRSIEALELPDDITLEDLKGLEKLPHLRELSTRARLGSREFEALAQLRELRALRIPEAKLSDADAAKLSQLTHLELFVSPHGVTNDGLKSLASLKKLRTLDLSHAETASADLPWLPELPGVTDLNLQGHTISAATLSKLPRLVRLNLNSAPVDRKLVQAMTKLTRLRDLDLSETSVAESDVQHLLQLEQLRFLNVFHTGIRDGGWLSLAKLPKLRVLLIGPGVASNTCAKLRMDPHLLFVGDVQSRQLWEPLGAGSRCSETRARRLGWLRNPEGRFELGA